MAKAKKLPSGNWNIRVYDRTDSNGKLIYQSFTATTKSEAEAKAAAYQSNKHRIQRNELTIGEAVIRYIEVKEGTLSESTIAGYVKESRQLKPIESIRIDKVSSVDLQSFISYLNRTHSPKTIKNIIGLVLSSIKMFRPDAVFNITLPMYIKPKLKIPSDGDIKALITASSRKMKLCIALGCKSVRRGEICAIKLKDIEKIGDGQYQIHIHGDCVLDRNNRWVYKDTPKTPESDRYVLVSQQVIDLIDTTDKDAYIVDYRPDTISKMFSKTASTMGLNITFHTTRHYYASIMAVLGVPDFMTAEMGGWRDVHGVMKRVYQGIQSDRARHYLQQTDSHFNSLLDSPHEG